MFDRAMVAALAALSAFGCARPVMAGEPANVTIGLAPAAASGEVHVPAGVRVSGASQDIDRNTAPVTHVTVSTAADLVGRPVDIFHPKSLVPGPGSVPEGMPVAATRLTSRFGLREHPLLGILREHLGVDLAAPYGSPIVATSDGIVERARWAGGYGLEVSLDSAGGVETRYGHMSRISVSAGERVRRGQVIGYVGSTGLSTGPHLHYEVRLNGRAVNPLPYIEKK